MREPDEWPFPDFGPLPPRPAVEVLSVQPAPGGIRIVLFVPTSYDEEPQVMDGHQ